MEQEDNFEGTDQQEEEDGDGEIEGYEGEPTEDSEMQDVNDDEMEDEEEVIDEEEEEEDAEEEGGDDDDEEEEEEVYDDEEDEVEGDEDEQDAELDEGEELEEGEEPEEDEDDIEEDEEAEDDADEDEGEWEAFDEDCEEKCPVCLDNFFDKEVGTPESCDHVFCLECILEWSRNINTCPVDRSLYRSILVRHSYHGEVVRRIEVDERKPSDEQDEEPATYCEVCGRCDREDRLLLCDGCDAGYHCECLDPPLERIPIEEWYCPECIAQNRHQEEMSSEDESEVIDRGSRPSHVTRERPAARAIARTHVSERVRARITLARAERQQEQPSTSGSRVSRPLTSTMRKKPVRKPTRKKKTRKRKVTKRRKTMTSKTSATGKKVVKKRKVKRRKKRKSKIAGRVTKSAGPKTIRGRIAGKLMLVKPRTGSMMPDVKVKGHQSLNYRRHEIGAATLTITGSDDLLDQASDTSIAKAKASSTGTRTPAFVSSSSTSDLLGNIFQEQTMLHMASKEITIHRDGSLSKITQDSQDNNSPRPRRLSSSDQTNAKDSDELKVKSQSNTSSRHFKEDTLMKNDHEMRRSSNENLEEDEAKNVTEQISGHQSPAYEGDDSDEDVGEDNDTGMEGDEGDKDEEMEEISDGEKIAGKHDGSITCQASSSSFEESEEENVFVDKKLVSRRTKDKAYHKEEEGLIDDNQDRCIQNQNRGKGLKSHRNDTSRRSQRMSSLEEGLIDEEGDKEADRMQRRNSLSEEEGLIEDDQENKIDSVSKRQVSHSDEEGLIADDEDVTKAKQDQDTMKQEETVAKRHHGHSSAEEGEVKTDDEEGSSSSKKKRKRERRRQRNRKDTRMVVIDSDISVTIPKRPIVEIHQGRKKTSEGRSSDSATSREREFERGESQRADQSVFGDLRHVIQVKRDVPYKRPSRYDAYWNELERQRKLEDELAEKAVAWDSHGIYERPYPYEEDWGRMVLDHHPPERHWENFTIHRERSPVESWRKSTSMERRVEAERRIEVERQMEHERFEAERKAEIQRKMESERRITDRKLDGRKDVELKNEHRVEVTRNGSKKVESVKGRSDHKRGIEPVKQRHKNDFENKRDSSNNGDADRRHKSSQGSENDKRKHEDVKRDSRHKIDSNHPEKDRHRHQRNKERDKTERVKDSNISDPGKQREAKWSDPLTRSTSASKSSSNREKDRRRDKQNSQTKQKTDQDLLKNKRGREPIKVKGHSAVHGKERSTSHDTEQSHGVERTSSHKHDRSVSSTRHHEDKRDQQRQERSTSRQHDRSLKQIQDHSSHSHDNRRGSVDKHRQQSDKSKTKVQTSSKIKEKDHGKERSKNIKENEKRKQENRPQASSTSDEVVPVQVKSKKKIRARSPSTSQTGDELQTTEPTTQRPITVPATEMVVDKPVVEKPKKKKKDKAKKVKNKTNEDGKVKKTKKTKAGKTKKQKAVVVVVEEAQQIEENVPEEVLIEEEPQDEMQVQPEEAVPESGENKRPASSPVTEEPAKKARTEDETEDQDNQEKMETPEIQEPEEKKDLHQDSSSDVEVVDGPTNCDEIIDLSQISSDEESLPSTSEKPRAKESTLYDPFEPTASPETISSPDISERHPPNKNHRSRDRSRSQQRRSARSPVARGSSPRRRVSPRRQRSFSPRRKSPLRQTGSSKDRGYSSRKRSPSPPKRSLQKRRSPSPKRLVAAKKSTYSPSRSQRRHSPTRHASPKRAVSPRKRSISPRRKTVSKRRHAESPRRRSVSPRRNLSPKRRIASPRKSISPRRRNVSPRRRSRSPKKRSVSPRRQRVSPRRQPMAQKRHSISPRRKSASRNQSSSPRRRDVSPRRKSISPRKQIRSSRRTSLSPKRRSVSQQRRVVSPRRAVSPRRSVSSRSYSSSSRSSRSPSSSSSWSTSSDSWSSNSYSRSPSLSSRSPSPRGRRYSSRDRSSSSDRSRSSFSSESSSPYRGSSPRRRSPSPKRTHQVLRRSPTQTSPSYRRRMDSERSSPIPAPQPLPDSTQGSYKVVSTSPRSPNQTMAPATSTTDTHLSSSASSQISHILGQLASNPAIQSALNSANLSIQKGHDDSTSSTGSISGFLKSSEASFTSPQGREAKTRGDMEDKDLLNLDDVNEDNIESSAVDLYNKNSRDRYLKKLQHQERVVEEVKLALKPYYQKREVSKDDYKEILRKSVNQVCHSKSGEINPVKIKKLIEGYIKKFKCKKKVDDKKETRPDLTSRLLAKS